VRKHPEIFAVITIWFVMRQQIIFILFVFSVALGIFIIFFLYLQQKAIDVGGCKKSCDELSTDHSKVLFYGTDDEDHLITYSKKSGTSVMKCYRDCGVTAVYPGNKGCPNYCFSYFGQGNCWEGECVCNDGWTGPDCNTIQCPNSCSNHGVCLNATNTCLCDEGFFSNDCSAPIGT
jgi:hypothetical protein